MNCHPYWMTFAKLCLFKKHVFHLHRCQSHSGHFTKTHAANTHNTALHNVWEEHTILSFYIEYICQSMNEEKQLSDQS